MTAGRNPLKHIRLVFRRSSPLVKSLVIAALAVCTVTLLALSIGIAHSKKNTDQLRQEAASYQQENAQLQEDIGKMGTVESIKELARRLLGLVDPDTVFFSPEE